MNIWRQASAAHGGRFVRYVLDGISPSYSLLEAFDVLNARLLAGGQVPVAFESDCREGICGACSMMINGAAHGPERATTTYDRLQWPRNASLESWAVKTRQHLTGNTRALVLASNHFEGFAPITCQRMAAEFGMTIQLPDPKSSPKPDSEDRQLGLGL